MKQVRPRQIDVAKHAGVSPAVVSLVINGRVDGNVPISAETQQRVWSAVRSLGYVPNPVARSLAGGANRLIGVFSLEPVFSLRQQDFHYPCLIGLEEEAAAQDYDLILFTRTGGRGERRSIYRNGVNTLQLADGAILLGDIEPGEQSDEIRRLLDDSFPFVFVGRRDVSDARLSYVAADYTGATAEAVTHLLTLGHRRIAYIGPDQPLEWNEDREQGFRQAHLRLGLPLDERLILHCPKTDVTADLLTRCLAQRVTAFVVDGTIHALALLRLARALGMRVPTDFSLLDVDDATTLGPHDEIVADRLLPQRRGVGHGTAPDSRAARELLMQEIAAARMATILVPRQEMGIHAVRLLIEILSHPDQPGPQRVALPCTIIPGDTIAPPPTTQTGI